MPDYLDTWSRDRSIGKLNWVQQLALKTQPQKSTALQLIDSMDTSQLARYMDTSHWNGKINISLMKPYIHAHMAKCSDGKQMIAGSVNDMNTYVDDQFSDVVQQCYDSRLPVIAYHYWQPDVVPSVSKDNDRQYQAMIYALRSKKPGTSYHEIRVDLEQKSSAYHVTVRDRFQTFWGWLLEDFGNKIPLSIYTSVGYLGSVPALRDFIILHSIPVHFAQWVYNTKTIVSWEQAINKVNSWNMKVLNFHGWRAVQLSSSLYGMAGCGPGEIDWNVHNGTPVHLHSQLKFNEGTAIVVPPPPPPPPLPPIEEPTPVEEGSYVTLAAFNGFEELNSMRYSSLRTYAENLNADFEGLEIRVNALNQLVELMRASIDSHTMSHPGTDHTHDIGPAK